VVAGILDGEGGDQDHLQVHRVQMITLAENDSFQARNVNTKGWCFLCCLTSNLFKFNIVIVIVITHTQCNFDIFVLHMSFAGFSFICA
jgi:hypothetical protein